MNINILSPEQGKVITQGLLKAFCYKDMNHFSYMYVMTVLYPEYIIRLIMDFYSIDFETVNYFTVTCVKCVLFVAGWNKNDGTAIITHVECAG